MEVGLDGGQNTGAARRRGPLAHRGDVKGWKRSRVLALALLLLLLEKDDHIHSGSRNAT